MRNTPNIFVAFACISCGISSLARADAPGSFSVTAVKINPTNAYYFSTGMNDSGQVAVNADFGSTALRWSPSGEVISVAPSGSQAVNILNNGKVLSASSLPTGQLGFTLGDQNGWAYLPLPLTATPRSTMAVAAASGDNTIVGSVDAIPTLWNGNTLAVTQLSPCNALPTIPYSISHNGNYICGLFGDNNMGGAPGSTGVTKPFVFHNGIYTPIDVPGGYTYAVASGVNDSGEVIGYTSDYFTIDGFWAAYDRGFTWKDGSFSWLGGGLQNKNDCFPIAINNSGTILDSNSAIWLNGVRYELSSLCGDISATPYSPYYPAYPKAINDAGQILVDGIWQGISPPGYSIPTILTPVVPEPLSANAMLGLSAFGLLTRRRL